MRCQGWPALGPLLLLLAHTATTAFGQAPLIPTDSAGSSPLSPPTGVSGTPDDIQLHSGFEVERLPPADASQAATIADLMQRMAANEAELADLRAEHAAKNARPTAGLLTSQQKGAPATGIESRIAELQQSLKESKNRFPLIRLSGLLQCDIGFFSQDAASLSTLGNIQNGAGFRRARLQALGKVAEFTNYTIEMDFAFPGRPSFMDVWGEQTNLPIGNVRIGQYRQPVTLDGATSVRHLDFLERSAPFFAFDPFRRVGIMDWWNAEDGRTMLAASVYATGWTFWNGSATQYSALGFDNRFGTQIGDNGGVAVAVRGSHLLWYDEPANGRYLLHVGGGYNFGQIGGDGVNTPGTVGSQTYQASSIPEFFVGDQAGNFATSAGTPNVLDTGRYLAHNYSLLHFELAGNAGSFHWQTEWMGTAVAQYGGPMVFYDGAYVQCGYFLTGESVGYNKTMGALDYNCMPFSEFFGLGHHKGICGWGAWEVAARWSYLDLQSGRINPTNYQGAGPINPATGLPTGLTVSNGGNGPSPAFPNPGLLNESTVALNWYWNQYTRVQFNWIHNMLSSQYHGFSAMDIFAARYQLEF